MYGVVACRGSTIKLSRKQNSKVVGTSIANFKQNSLEFDELECQYNTLRCTSSRAHATHVLVDHMRHLGQFIPYHPQFPSI